MTTLILTASKHTWIPSLLCAFALAGGASAQPAAVTLTPEEAAWLEGHREWRASYFPAPPFCWIDDEGVPQGICKDIAILIEKKLGVKIRPEPSDSPEESLSLLETGASDVALLAAPSGGGGFGQSDEILRLPTIVITRADSSGIDSFEDLNDRKVAVARHWPLREKLAREHPEIILAPLDNTEAALASVALGKADAFVGDLPSAAFVMKAAGMTNLRVVTDAPYAFPLRIAVRPDWPEALSILNKAIASITEQDRTATRRKWMAARDSGISLRDVIRVALPTLVILVLIVLSAANARLKQAVAQSGEELREALARLANQNAFLDAEVARRTKEIEMIKDATVLALAGLAETRDTDTGRHLRRTQLYVRTIAESAARRPRFHKELTPEVIAILFKTAPLHDIGKVGIPDTILLKPGRLTPEEFAVMKNHVALGGKAIAAAEAQAGTGSSFLRYAREIVMTHHEKWDGTGYPKGLRGENIPLSGRIMAIADVYDAVRTKRVYKDAVSHEEAVEIIRDGRGTHFDPELTDVFLEVSGQFARIASDLAD